MLGALRATTRGERSRRPVEAYEVRLNVPTAAAFGVDFKHKGDIMKRVLVYVAVVGLSLLAWSYGNLTINEYNIIWAVATLWLWSDDKKIDV